MLEEENLDTRHGYRDRGGEVGEREGVGEKFHDVTLKLIIIMRGRGPFRFFCYSLGTFPKAPSL